jgi:hypothetical protein
MYGEKLSCTTWHTYPSNTERFRTIINAFFYERIGKDYGLKLEKRGTVAT